VINEMEQTIDDIGKEKLLKEIETLRPQMEKRARRMYEVPDVTDASDYSDKLALAMTIEVVQDGK